MTPSLRSRLLLAASLLLLAWFNARQPAPTPLPRPE